MAQAIDIFPRPSALLFTDLHSSLVMLQLCNTYTDAHREVIKLGSRLQSSFEVGAISADPVNKLIEYSHGCLGFFEAGSRERDRQHREGGVNCCSWPRLISSTHKLHFERELRSTSAVAGHTANIGMQLIHFLS